jgi:hypothetical protein
MLASSQLVSGEESLKQRDDSRKAAGHNEDTLLEHLRSLLKTADCAAISHIFTKSKNVTVARDRFGHIRILVGDVSDELLQTKINAVTFKSSERYNVKEAITPIIRAKEIQAKLNKLGVEQPLTFLSGHVLESDPRLPHLPPSMKNVTMEEALDRVAQTFGGLIIYGEWAADGTRLFSVDFARLGDFEGVKKSR